MTVVEDLQAVVDGLVALEASALADGEAVAGLHRQLARLEAVTARAAAAFDKARAWAPDGARTASAWIAGTCRLPSPAVKRRLRLGRAMAVLPVAAEAWLAGDVDAAHVALLRRARQPGLEAVMARDEAVLVGHARSLPFTQFAQAMAYWYQAAAPERAEADAADLVVRRRCHLSSTLDGMVRGDFELDPVRGAIVDTALRRIYDELFEYDWAEAKERLGRDPAVDELRRTPAQRRADAVVEMATRAQAVPKGARRPRPLFSVYVNYDVLKRLCELADGTVVPPGSLVPWLSGAELERVVFDGQGRVTDIGPRRRFFRGATRRAVQLRDRKCFHPLCDEPAEHCEIDHKTAYSDGGPTIQANGQPACGFHNRWKHKTGRKPADNNDERDGDDEQPAA
jgi:hypothetical protein